MCPAKGKFRITLMTKPNKNPFRWVKNHKFLSFFLLLIISVPAFWGWQTYQKHQNKVAFQQARSAIDEIYKEILVRVGMPDDSKSINECSRPNQEFTEGPLSCVVGTSLIYAVANRGEASQKYKAVQNIINTRSDLFKPVGPLSTEIKDEFVVNSYYHSAFDRINTVMGMGCSAKYVYDTPENMDLNVDSEHSLQIFIGCSSLAKQIFYPLIGS